MIDYDFIMNGGWDHRVALLDLLTPEEKAELVLIHRRRWLAANHHRLSAEQVNAIEEDIAFIVPELYLFPKDPVLSDRAKQLEQRAIRLFAREDLYDITLHGHRIPELP